MGIVTCSITVSADGFVAGPNQSVDNPLGENAEQLHRWQFEQREENADEVASLLTAGAYIMGRKMFGPDRGEWDLNWTGWWGEDPPYRAPVFVLGHRPRPPVEMAGGTTFHFVTEGIEAALERAKAVAGERDVAIAGGASTVNQYLAAGLIDELRLHVAPVILGSGERLFDGVGPLKLTPIARSGTDLVTHIRYRLGE